ncbi:MAG: hypothetical protein JNM85_10020 [Chthonomonas sp.]|nr:hypothetical protein [Chthonomonas sp.]
MTSALLCLTLAFQVTSPADDATRASGPSAAEVVSKMFNRYFESKSTVATIQFVQSVSNIAVQTDTVLQFDAPSKVYIRQVRRSLTSPAESLVTSNGTHFSYNPPEVAFQAKGQERLIESVVQQGKALGVREIYSASSASLIDRSVPMDIIFGRLEDLKYMRLQWASVGFTRSPNQDGDYAIGGDWREYGAAPVAGKYELVIGKDYEIKRYSVRETLGFENQVAGEVVSTWNVVSKTNSAGDAKLYTLVR